jgi:hypothetical protein
MCVDFLPVFKKYPIGDIFFMQRPRYYDVWHLKDFGHQVTAEELLRQLEEVIPFAHPELSDYPPAQRNHRTHGRPSVQ